MPANQQGSAAMSSTTPSSFVNNSAPKANQPTPYLSQSYVCLLFCETNIYIWLCSQPLNFEILCTSEHMGVEIFSLFNAVRIFSICQKDDFVVDLEMVWAMEMLFENIYAFFGHYGYQNYC